MPKKTKKNTKKKETKKTSTKKNDEQKEQPKKSRSISKNDIIIVLCGIVLILFVVSLKTYYGGEEIVTEDTTYVEDGDIVKVKYAGKFENGTLFDTNYKELAEENSFSVSSETLDFEVGGGKVINGFDQAVLGMKENERKTVRISPENAYGLRDESLELTWPSAISRQKAAHIGRTMVIKREDLGNYFSRGVADKLFEEGEVIHSDNENVDYTVLGSDDDAVYFRIDTEEGDIIHLPGTNWDSLVSFVNETTIIAIQSPKIGQTAQTQWGEYNVTVSSGGNYILFTKLKEGNRIYVNGRYGTVTKIDGEKVYFDSNHPLAGKTLVFDIEVVEIEKKE